METVPNSRFEPGTASGSVPTLADAESCYEQDARAIAILRGAEIARNDLVRAGGAYDLTQVQLLLGGISRQAVAKRVQEGSLLAVPGPQNKRRYPTFQFCSDGSLVAGMSAVVAALPTRNPWAVVNYLVHPDSRLGGKVPIELLRQGHVAPVADAAARLGEQGD